MDRFSVLQQFLRQSCLDYTRIPPEELYIVTEPEEKGWTRSIAMLHKSDSLMTETALDFLEFCRDYFRERR